MRLRFAAARTCVRVFCYRRCGAAPCASGPGAFHRHPASHLQRRGVGLHVPVVLDADDTLDKVALVRDGLDGCGGRQALRLPRPARTGESS